MKSRREDGLGITLSYPAVSSGSPFVICVRGLPCVKRKAYYSASREVDHEPSKQANSAPPRACAKTSGTIGVSADGQSRRQHPVGNANATAGMIQQIIESGRTASGIIGDEAAKAKWDARTAPAKTLP